MYKQNGVTINVAEWPNITNPLITIVLVVGPAVALIDRPTLEKDIEGWLLEFTLSCCDRPTIEHLFTSPV